MRGGYLMVISAVVILSARSQDMDPLAVITPSEFSMSDSPCVARHDPSVEKVLQVVAIRMEGAKSPETGSVVTVEMRNASAKTITAYLLTFTVTRGGRTEHFGALGKDLVYDLALTRHARRAAPASTSFLPGQVYRAEIWRGRPPGHFEVYPCVAVFDDGTGIGLSQGITSVQTGRLTQAKRWDVLIRELELARDSGDPGATLLLRAKRVQDIRFTATGPSGSPIRISASGPRVDLEATATELSGNHDAPAAKKFLADRIAVLRALRETLSELSGISHSK
jgi:hypothetical protein